MVRKVFQTLFFVILLSVQCQVVADSAIVAVVGEEVITTKDLSDRYQFFLIENPKVKISNSQQKKALYSNILKSMIDESILYQELDKLKIKITQDEINQAIRFIESRQKMKQGEFFSYLRKSGISKEYAISQIEKNILWEKFMDEIISPQIQIGNNEILEFLSVHHPDKIIVDFVVIDSDNQDLLSAARREISSCSDVDRLRNVSTKRQKLKLSSVQNDDIRRAVILASEKHPSHIFNIRDKKNFVFICEKIKPQEVKLINKIMGSLKQQKIALQAEYQIKNYAKNKHIEIFDTNV
ncbi:MAG: SurA N-terminal domain-containing protein [Rickettsiales bacterium]